MLTLLVLALWAFAVVGAAEVFAMLLVLQGVVDVIVVVTTSSSASNDNIDSQS